MTYCYSKYQKLQFWTLQQQTFSHVYLMAEDYYFVTEISLAGKGYLMRVILHYSNLSKSQDTHRRLEPAGIFETPRIIEKIHARVAVIIQRNDSVVKTEEGERAHTIQYVSYVITLYFTNAHSIFSHTHSPDSAELNEGLSREKMERKENIVPLCTLARSL